MPKSGGKDLKIKSKVESVDFVDSVELVENVDFMESVESVDLTCISGGTVRLSIYGTVLGLVWGCYGTGGELSNC